MEELLTARLLASAGIAGLCGERVGWQEADQDWSPPYIVLHVISGPRDYHLTGKTALERWVIQANCVGATRVQAKAVSDALDAFSEANLWDGTISAKVSNRRTTPSAGDGPDKVYSRSTDLRVQFKGA